mgnify:CR=1 FL=1
MNDYINDEIELDIINQEREEAELTHSIACRLSLCVNKDAEFIDFVQNKVIDIAISLRDEFDDKQQKRNLEISRGNFNDVIPF